MFVPHWWRWSFLWCLQSFVPGVAWRCPGRDFSCWDIEKSLFTALVLPLRYTTRLPETCPRMVRSGIKRTKRRWRDKQNDENWRELRAFSVTRKAQDYGQGGWLCDLGTEKGPWFCRTLSLVAISCFKRSRFWSIACRQLRSHGLPPLTARCTAILLSTSYKGRASLSLNAVFTSFTTQTHTHIPQTQTMYKSCRSFTHTHTSVWTCKRFQYVWLILIMSWNVMPCNAMPCICIVRYHSAVYCCSAVHRSTVHCNIILW